MSSRRLNILLAALLGLSTVAARGDVTSISVIGGSRTQPVTQFDDVEIWFTLTRTGDTSYPVKVWYQTANGTAIAEYHYEPAFGAAVLDGAAEVEVPIELKAGDTDSAMTFYVNLVDATAYGPSPQFAAQQSFATGAYPVAVEVADVNGDGKPDLVVANRGADTVSVLLNTMSPGAATPSFAGSQSLTTADYPTTIAVADFNNDGKPDLAVGYGTQNDLKQATVFLNETAPGSGTIAFAAAQPFSTGDAPSAIVAADLNTDGKPDLVAVSQTESTLSVLLNTAAPGAPAAAFAAPQTLVAPRPSADIVATDVNDDGRPDLAIPGMHVLLNTTAPAASTAGFGTWQQFWANTATVEAGDLNQDGLDDLYSSGVTLLNATVPGAATADFLSIQYVNQSVSYGTGRADSADVNGDGLADIVLTSSTGVAAVANRSGVVVNVADFATPASFTLTAGAHDVAVADLNADGKADVVAPVASTNGVAVLLNTVPDTAFSAQYEASFDVAQAIGTILPRPQVAHQGGGGGIGGRALLLLLGAAIFRCKTARKSARANHPA